MRFLFNKIKAFFAELQLFKNMIKALEDDVRNSI